MQHYEPRENTVSLTWARSRNFLRAVSALKTQSPHSDYVTRCYFNHCGEFVKDAVRTPWDCRVDAVHRNHLRTNSSSGSRIWPGGGGFVQGAPPPPLDLLVISMLDKHVDLCWEISCRRVKHIGLHVYVLKHAVHMCQVIDFEWLHKYLLYVLNQPGSKAWAHWRPTMSW